MQGKLLIFSGPSGAGKTTIVHSLLETRSDLEFSVSACSRPRRVNEKEGVDYYFISSEEFRNRINNDEFLEWQEVYKDSFYGTLKSELERIWAKNKHVIFDVDVIGGLNIKKYGKNNAISIFVMPPSIGILEERLKIRASETADTLKRRLDKAAYELSFSNQFDRIIVNDNIETSVNKAKIIIEEFVAK